MNKSSNFDTNNRNKWVGLIGSRNASKEELQTAYKFAQVLIKTGYIVVSGLALGVDTEAHRGAIDIKGKTIAIVNTPPSQNIYPSQNKVIANKIKQYGCIIYPYTMTAQESNSGMSQFSKRLIERDMLLAWSCDKIVAVKNEGIIDGGTRYAMNYGREFGKKVFRLDNNMKLHLNPEVKEGKIWWESEVKMDRWKNFMDYKLDGEYSEN